MTTTELPLGHAFTGVAGHADDDECTHRADGTDATYCGKQEDDHEQHEPVYCSHETYAASLSGPAEYCEAETGGEDFCAKHEGGDEPDYDQIRKDRILDERES